MTSTTKIPVWFWIIAVVALLWNLMGVGAYIDEAFMTDDVMAVLPQNVQEGYANRPAWVTGAFAIAVFAGTLGCIALLIRKKWAVQLFLISLIGVLAQQTYNFFLQEYVPLDGVNMVMPILIVIVAALLYFFSKGAREKVWLS